LKYSFIFLELKKQKKNITDFFVVMVPNKLDGQLHASRHTSSTSIVNIYYYVFKKEY